MIILLPEKLKEEYKEPITILISNDEEQGEPLYSPLEIYVPTETVEEIPKTQIVIPQKPEEPSTDLNVTIPLPPKLEPIQVRNILSILNELLRGENIYTKKCDDTLLFIPLFLNNYLSEFLTEEEKQLVRTNLGIYSESDINDIISARIEKLSFITESDLNVAIEAIKFVDSKNKGYINYDIEDKLFKS